MPNSSAMSLMDRLQTSCTVALTLPTVAGTCLWPHSQGLRQDVVMIVHTIGHSTRTTAELVALLREGSVDLVADVRRFPRSRTNPQFNAETLGPTLQNEGIGYRHLAALGGRRSAADAKAPSGNTLWRQAAFRAYSDYAETGEFRAGLEALLDVAHKHSVAIMCAEAVWWRCHRRIVADYLLARGV